MPRKNFCLTVPKNAVGDSFSLSLKSSLEKHWMTGWGGECQHFPSKVSCLEMPKNFERQIFSVSIILGVERVYASAGHVSIFCRKILSQSAKKFHMGTFCAVFQINSGSQKMFG